MEDNMKKMEDYEKRRPTKYVRTTLKILKIIVIMGIVPYYGI
jgi:hypothetical protein